MSLQAFVNSVRSDWATLENFPLDCTDTEGGAYEARQALQASLLLRILGVAATALVSFSLLKTLAGALFVTTSGVALGTLAAITFCAIALTVCHDAIVIGINLSAIYNAKIRALQAGQSTSWAAAIRHGVRALAALPVRHLASEARGTPAFFKDTWIAAPIYHALKR